MNKEKFLGMQKYNGYKGKETAKLLGITEQTLSRIINKRKGSDFDREHLEILKRTWNLSNEQFDEIFFSKEVSKNDTKEN